MSRPFTQLSIASFIQIAIVAGCQKPRVEQPLTFGDPGRNVGALCAKAGVLAASAGVINHV